MKELFYISVNNVFAARPDAKVLLIREKLVLLVAVSLFLLHSPFHYTKSADVSGD